MDAPARRLFQHPQRFRMHRGGELPGFQLAYETWGELSAERDNAVLVFTGLSPSAHAAASPADPSSGWWQEMIGEGLPLDTSKLFVICVNSLGSCYGSTGPASSHPGDGEPWGLRFPVLTLEDVAASTVHLLDHLELAQLFAVVGPSMGGMTAQAFAVRYPERLRRLVLLSTAARSLPFSTAIRSLQREMIRTDPAWDEGRYTPGAGPIQGMRLARKLGMISYRSAREWRERFGRERIPEERRQGDSFDYDFEIESYLEAHAQKFTGQFDANCYLYLSRAMDLFDLAEHGGSVATALSRIAVERCLVIGVTTDLLFPVDQQRTLAEGLAAGTAAVEFVELPSIQGHDAFLVDMDGFRPAVGQFLWAD
jgi:homoserine O-acetyltransferase/O-succinyltransferase